MGSIFHKVSGDYIGVEFSSDSLRLAYVKSLPMKKEIVKDFVNVYNDALKFSFFKNIMDKVTTDKSGAPRYHNMFKFTFHG